MLLVGYRCLFGASQNIHWETPLLVRHGHLIYGLSESSSDSKVAVDTDDTTAKFNV